MRFYLNSLNLLVPLFFPRTRPFRPNQTTHFTHVVDFLCTVASRCSLARWSLPRKFRSTNLIATKTAAVPACRVNLCCHELASAAREDAQQHRTTAAAESDAVTANSTVVKRIETSIGNSERNKVYRCCIFMLTIDIDSTFPPGYTQNGRGSWEAATTTMFASRDYLLPCRASPSRTHTLPLYFALAVSLAVPSPGSQLNTTNNILQ